MVGQAVNQQSGSGSNPTPSLQIIPYTLRKANDFVAEYHRHNGRTARNGGKFAIGLSFDDEVVGIAIVGNPLSATYMDGFTAEVLRVCTKPDSPKNSNSMLYGACRRIWFDMGGKRLITYTLTYESGISLKASGWTWEKEIKGHGSKTWGKNDHLTIRKDQDVVALRKNRWQVLRKN